MNGDLIVDARALQDPGFSYRGIGQHLRTVLANVPRTLGRYDDVRLVAKLDPRMPELDETTRQLFDYTVHSDLDKGLAPICFLQPSPMTHSPLPLANLLRVCRNTNISILHDFIPFDFPNFYLTDAIASAQYDTCIKFLKYYDLFISNSEYTKRRFEQLAYWPNTEVSVSGVSVRDCFATFDRKHELDADASITVIGGDDPRKNVDIVLQAHAQISEFAERLIPLTIIGNYRDISIARMRALYAANGGNPELLQFVSGLTDEQLTRRLANSIVSISPSLVEGFSIPVVEANACGVPVLASDCAAHRELLPIDDHLFDPDDLDRLKLLLKHVVFDEGARKRALRAQAGLWERFSEKEVSKRFWKPVADLLSKDDKAQEPHRIGFTRLRNAKPKLAILTPMPPDRSGIADYSHSWIEDLVDHADVHLFSETRMPNVPVGTALVDEVSFFPFVSSKFDHVISVIGNSHYHLKSFNLLCDYGGICIAHDARMADFYAHCLGTDRATKIAGRELGRDVSVDEMNGWLSNPAKLPTLFLSEMLKASDRFIVHSPATRTIMADLYKANVDYIPFAFYNKDIGLRPPEAERRRLKERYGFATNDIVFCTFGEVASSKGVEECIWAILLLKGWGITAYLAFVGSVPEHFRTALLTLAAEYGVADQIRLGSPNVFVSRREYIDYLHLCDGAIQLRKYKLGGLSGALMDCIAAGCPSVANDHLAEAMEGPDFVQRIPDLINPLNLADALSQLVENRQDEAALIHEAEAYREARSFRNYNNKLLAGLGYADS